MLASSSSQTKEKEKKQRKKIIEKKKNAEKGGSLPSNSRSTLSLLAPISSLLFFTFRFKHFLLGIFFFSNKRKEKKTQRKKNHRKEKKCKEGRELTFLLSLLHLG
jgi:hypothetical protein